MSRVHSPQGAAHTQPGSAESSFAQRLADRLLGPRDWCVVDDGSRSAASPDNIYAIPMCRRFNSDRLLAFGLRKKAARRFARRYILRVKTPETGTAGREG